MEERRLLEGENMSRLAVLCFSMLMCGILFACETNGSASLKQKIGVVNVNRILIDSEPGRAATKYMEGLQDSLRAQATELQKKMQEVSEKDTENEAKQKEVQMEFIRLQSKMQAEQQNVNNILNDVLHRVIEKFRVDQGYSLIVFSDVALSFDEKTDVTAGVIQAMNTEKVIFTPLPEPKMDVQDEDTSTEKAKEDNSKKVSGEEKSGEPKKEESKKENEKKE